MINDKTQDHLLDQKGAQLEQNLNNLSENIFIFATGIKALYESSDKVTDEDLSNYVITVSNSNWSKNLVRVRYVERVSNDKIDEFTRRMLSTYSKFKINPNLSFTEQYFVTQVVDQFGKKYDPSGLNLDFDINRRIAIQKAVLKKTPVVFSVPSVVDVEGYTGAGLIFVVPVVKNNQVVGVVNALINVDSVIEDIKKNLNDEVYILDWEGEGKIYSNIVPSYKLASKELIIKISEDTEWKIIIALPYRSNSSLNLILGLGVSISFLLYIMVYGLASAGVRGEMLAKRLTSKLFKYKLALDSASNHVVITDANGIVVYANQAAQKLTGYSLSEIIGKTPRLWGGQMPKDFYTDFWKQIKIDKKVFSGDFNNRRKNGEKYIAQSTVSPIIDENGDLLGFVGVEVDVTEERKLFKQNTESMEKLNKFNQLMVGREIKMLELKKELSDLKIKNEKQV
jgi:PAS domain S-box-containing protein